MSDCMTLYMFGTLIVLQKFKPKSKLTLIQNDIKDPMLRSFVLTLDS